MSEIIDLGNIDAIDEMTPEEIEEIINDTKKTLNEYLNQVFTLPKLDMSKLLIYCGYINNLK